MNALPAETDVVPPAPAPMRHTGLLNIVVKLGGTALGFALNIMLARSLTASGFAEVSLALAWLALATALGSLSTPLLLMRVVGESLALGRPDLARGVIRFALLAALLCAATLSATALLALHLGWLAPATADPQLALLCLALILPNVLLSVLTGLLQALRQVVLAELLGTALRSLLMLAALAALTAGSDGTPLSATRVMALYLGVALALLALAAWLARRAQHAALRTRAVAYQPGPWAAAGLGLLVIVLAVAATERLDLLMLGWRAAPDEVAQYSVAQRFAQILLFAVNAVGAALAPQFMALLPALRAGRGEAAEALVRSSARLSLWTCLAAWLGFALLGPWMTRWFGAGYAAAYAPLLILVSGQLIAALFGPGVLLATLTGSTRFVLADLGLAMALNAALNWFAVPHWGAVGAAGATACAGIFSAALAQAWLRRQLGIDIGVLSGRASGVRS